MLFTPTPVSVYTSAFCEISKKDLLGKLESLKNKNVAYMQHHCKRYYHPGDENKTVILTHFKIKKGILTANKKSIYEHVKLRNQYLKDAIENVQKVHTIDELERIKNHVLNRIQWDIKHDENDQGVLSHKGKIYHMLSEALMDFQILPGFAISHGCITLKT